MAERAFPVIFRRKVTATAEFYERLGFQRQYQLPPDGDPGYVGLRRGAAELAVVAADWPQQQYGAAVAAGVRFEIFVYGSSPAADAAPASATGLPSGSRSAGVGVGPTACPSRPAGSAT
jgi:lactoylglutathione lyase